MEELWLRLKEAFLEYKSRVEDAPAFQSLKERYETLSPKTQKIINWGSIVIVSLFFVSCPYGYFTESNEKMARFESRRSLMRDLLKAVQASSQLTGAGNDMDINTAQSRIQSIGSSFNLQPEQIGQVQQIPVDQTGSLLASTAITQNGIAANYKKLNLTQIINIGHRLQNIQDALKLVGIDIKATKDNDHYFDVTYQLVNFEAPQSETPEPSNTEKPRSKSPNSKMRNKKGSK